MPVLKKVVAKGFKSIRNQELELQRVNLLIGINGAGKSNLISLFQMLNYALTEGLQEFVALSGGASSLLHLGPVTTPQMEIKLEFEAGQDLSGYSQRLAHAAQDALVFLDEVVTFHKQGYNEPQMKSLGAGHKETLLNQKAESGDKTARVIRAFLQKCRVYQFHDTSSTAYVRLNSYVNDNRYLKSNGGNLAAYLYMLQEKHPQNYRQIVDCIRMVAPQFQNFDLAPLRLQPNQIRLDWRERQSEYLFGPHQLSDGLLRFMCLTTLLLQPENDLPNVLVIDEPELGLHPSALSMLAGMLRHAATRCQIVAATQSATLLDQFEPKDVIVVERLDRETTFNRPDEKQLDQWVRDYNTGELWQKNLLGGRP